MRRSRREISFSQALRKLGLKSKTTLHTYHRHGWIKARKVNGRWMADLEDINSAKLLTFGRAAKLAGVSDSTLRRRVRSGLVKPFYPRRSIEPAAGTPPPRLSLRDVALIRHSRQRRAPKKRRSVRVKGGGSVRRPPLPKLLHYPKGTYRLRYLNRWWRLERSSDQPPR